MESERNRLRREAADKGEKFFDTGKPCKYGHMSKRYVTNGGCVACQTGTFTPRRNPWTDKLVPFTSNKLWTAAHFTKPQRIALRVYLQTCVFAFLRANMQGLDLNARAELEAAMLEIEERGRFATADDPRNNE